MNFLALLTHASSVYSCVNAIIEIGSACVKEKRRPSNDEDIKIIEAFEKLALAGLVPGLPVDTVTSVLEDVKKLL